MNKRQNLSMPIKLPQLTLADVRLNNLLLNKAAELPFALHDAITGHCTLFPGHDAQRQICPIGMTLEIGGTLAGLWLSAWPLAEAIQQFVPTTLLNSLPENLRIGIIENALAPLITQASQGLGLSISIQSMSAERESLPATHMSLGFSLRLEDSHAALLYEGSGLLLLDAQLYPHLQERLRPWPSAFNPDWEEHPTNLRIEISRSTFSMQEINNLQPNDLILLEDTRFLEDDILRLRLDSGYYCEATLEFRQRSTLTITSEWLAVSTNDPQQTIEHIAQIPVQLSFDLGEKTLSFNEVRQLHPGYVLELGKSLPEIVQIRSQHRLIGTGELVEINGRVGVRIISLLNKKAKGS